MHEIPGQKTDALLDLLREMRGLSVTAPHAVQALGPREQGIVALEELAELSTELARWLRGRDDLNVEGEIADVLIVAMQMAYIFKTETVTEVLRHKMQRLRAKIHNVSRPDA